MRRVKIVGFWGGRLADEWTDLQLFYRFPLTPALSLGERGKRSSVQPQNRRGIFIGRFHRLISMRRFLEVIGRRPGQRAF